METSIQKWHTVVLVAVQKVGQCSLCGSILNRSVGEEHIDIFLPPCP
jgi:hypothetical protein